jgi:hypothetical protein
LSILDFISPGLTAASDVVGGYEKGQARADSERQAQVLAAIKQKRIDENDAVTNALKAAQAKAAGQIPVTYHDTESGDVVQLPTRIDAPPSATPPANPSPSPTPGPVASPAPTLATPAPVMDGGPKPGGPAAPPLAVGDTTAPPPVVKPPPPPIGVPTGIKGPKKAPLPGTPEWERDLVTQAVIKKKYGPQPQDDRTLVQVQQPDGSVIYMQRSQAAGQRAPSKVGAGTGNLAAPIAAKVGQFGEMLKKASDLTALTDNLDVTVGQSTTRDLAEHGVHIPFIGTMPGSKGVGSMLQSHSPEYSQYQAALSPFILAAAHALSGARINQDQVEQIRKSIELAPGDFGNKNVRAQKEKNMIDLINSIGGSLPKEAISAQEGQMDEKAILDLVGRGYRRIGGETTQPTKRTAAEILAAHGIK